MKVMQILSTGLLVSLAATLLAGCDKPPAKESLNEPSLINTAKLPEEMSDCKFFNFEYVAPGSHVATNMQVLRCPNSTTETSKLVSTGKSSHNERFIVLDGSAPANKADVDDKWVLTINGVKYAAVGKKRTININGELYVEQ